MKIHVLAFDVFIWTNQIRVNGESARASFDWLQEGGPAPPFALAKLKLQFHKTWITLTSNSKMLQIIFSCAWDAVYKSSLALANLIYAYSHMYTFTNLIIRMQIFMTEKYLHRRGTESTLLEVQCKVSTVSDGLGCHVICWCWSTVFSEVQGQHSRIPGSFRALHASCCWPTLWRCRFHFPTGLGTCTQCQSYQYLV